MTAAAPAARFDLRAWHWLAAAALAVGAVIAADYWRDGGDIAVEPQAPLDPADLRPSYGQATFGEALAYADREVAGRRELAARNPGDWLPMEALARALAARFRLSADPTDLVEADGVLERALEIAPYPAGPALSRAEVSLLKHDWLEAERALDRLAASAAAAPAAELAAARSMRCEIAIQQGLVDKARELCAGDGMASALLRANLAAKTGNTAEAIRVVEAELRGSALSPHALAKVALQRASLALGRGDWEDSGKWVRAAERVFPGYWLSEAFVAQQLALEGNRAGAIRRYAALAQRTGNPDVLDALASLAEAEGRGTEAAKWAAEAGAEWDRRMRLTRGYEIHQAEHELRYGDPRIAMVTAETEYLLGAGAGVVAHYGYIHWRNGEADHALAAVQERLSRGLLTADMKLVEALALGSLGRASEAGEAMTEARRLNPRIDGFRQQFVVFGRD
jgi:hypothetical protein